MHSKRMRLLRLLAAVLIGTVLTGTSVVQAQNDDTNPLPDLLVSGVWVRATADADMDSEDDADDTETDAMQHDMMTPGGVSAGYMTIENRSSQPYRLTAVETIAAPLVEIHETTMQDEVMRMQALDDGLIITPGETIVFEPGGYHLMLLDLRQTLVEGEALILLLIVEALDEDMQPVSGPEFINTGALILNDAPEPHPVIALDAWARPTVAGMALDDFAITQETESSSGQGHSGTATTAPGGASAAYMILLNTGEEAVRLVGADSQVAVETQIHTMDVQDDVMRLFEVEGIDIPAGETAVLEPGSYHVMLLDLQQELVSGQAIVVELRFDDDSRLRVPVALYDRDMRPMPMMP
jgi:periplasmic copper chaperone A